MEQLKAEARRLPGLDGLRAVSILFVLVWHLGGSGSEKSSVPVLGLFNTGFLGVSVFFGISGFLITYLLLKEESVSLPRFYERRAIRILPPAIAYLAVIAVACTVSGTVDWKGLLGSLFFYRNLVPGDSFAPGITDTAHYWSLAVEEQFYLVWPFVLVILAPRARVPLLAAVLCTLPVWRQLNYEVYKAQNVNSLRGDLVADCIVMGCMLACAANVPKWNRLLSHPLALSNITMVGCILGLGLASLMNVHLSGKIVAFFPTIRAGCIGLVVNRAVHAKPGGSIIDGALKFYPIALIGQLSYSLYLWQQPFTMPKGAFHSHRIFLNVIGAFACAGASFLLIERPSQFVRNRLLGRKISIIAGGQNSPPVGAETALAPKRQNPESSLFRS